MVLIIEPPVKNCFTSINSAKADFLYAFFLSYFLQYQQKVTIFVVGYENLCSHRNKVS